MPARLLLVLAAPLLACFSAGLMLAGYYGGGFLAIWLHWPTWTMPAALAGLTLAIALGIGPWWWWLRAWRRP